MDERGINYCIDDKNVLRVYSGNAILFKVCDVTSDEQAQRIIEDELEKIDEA